MIFVCAKSFRYIKVLKMLKVLKYQFEHLARLTRVESDDVRRLGRLAANTGRSTPWESG